jgi:hypothetical protein
MYDPNAPQDDEKEAESQYATLLAPPTDGGATAPTPEAPAPAPGPVARPGFVNFDRVMSANKSQVDSRRGYLQNSADSRYAALQAPQIDANPGLAAPNAGTEIVSGSQQALSNTGVTREEAEKNAKATYAGPTQQTVDSKYAPLIASANKLQEEAVAAKMGSYTGNRFDDALLGAAGGVQYKDDAAKKVQDAFKSASEGVAGAEKTFEENKSKWGALVAQPAPPPPDTSAADRLAGATEVAEARLGEMANPNGPLGPMGPKRAAEMRELMKYMTPEQLERFGQLHPDNGVRQYYMGLDALIKEVLADGGRK